MNGLLQHASTSLRLNFRNRMAVIYGYLFPLIFLFAFWAIYRHDRVPIVQHLGELLTVTALGGACFGLPTTMVSERERGVLRRYRLTPTPAWGFLASTLAVRYVLLVTAALIQFGLALALGMTFPAHPLGLLIAFTCVCIAFMGLGLVIAMIADNVPAVQALGQCIFLPMLMIGGVAVKLYALPDWAQHLSAFFPGRYAVQALQANVSGLGLAAVWFDLAALIAIGLGGLLAATMMFRWAPGPAPKGRKLWLLAAVAVWAVVGLAAEGQGRIAAKRSPEESVAAEQVGVPADYLTPVAPRATVPPPPAPTAEPAPEKAAPARAPEPPPIARPPASWRDVTEADVAGVAFERLPPDSGVVAPVAVFGETPDPAAEPQLDALRTALAGWAPGHVEDPVQRARNILYVAAVPDVLQMGDVERFIPAIALGRLRQSIPPADLPKVLYWVALHPKEGDDSAIDELTVLGLPRVNSVVRRDARDRVMLYAFKLLARTTGRETPA
jgi:ABC-2 type transport system permease protein